MKIYLGSEEDIDLDEKIDWLESVFSKDQYKIYNGGFLIRTYYITFANSKYESLYYVKFPNSNFC